MKIATGVWVILLLAGVVLYPMTSAHGQEDVAPADRAEEVEARRAEQAESLEDRIQARREEIQTDVNERRIANTGARCEAVKEAVSLAITRASEGYDNRLGIYQNISEKLDNIVARLQATGIDTTAVEADIATFGSMVDDFFVELESYQQSLRDTFEIDCVSQTEDFLLALQQARELRSGLKADAAAIKAHLKNTVTPALRELASQISADSDAPDDGAEQVTDES